MTVEGTSFIVVSLLLFRNRFSVSLHELLLTEPRTCIRGSAEPSHYSSRACSLASGCLPGDIRSGTHAQEEGRHNGWYKTPLLCFSLQAATFHPTQNGFTSATLRVKLCHINRDFSKSLAVNDHIWSKMGVLFSSVHLWNSSWRLTR